MKIELFRFSKKNNSTKVPTEEGFEIEVYLKDNTTLISPSFILKGNIEELLQYNYLKWNNGYYYIVTKQIITTLNQLSITCSLDSLATYKSDILNSTAFVTHSAKVYNVGIVDTRLSTDGSVTTERVFRENIFEYSPCYLISWLGEGGFQRGIVSYSELDALLTKQWDKLVRKTNVDAIYDDVVDGAIPESQQKLSVNVNYDSLNIADYIKNVKYLPITPDTYLRSEVCLGRYHTGIYARVPDATVKTGNLTIPRKWTDDFRKQSPFSQYILYLPCFGCMAINANDFLHKDVIAIKGILDGFSGDIDYIIENGYAKASTNISVDLPIGSDSSVGDVAKLLTLAGGLFSGTITAVAGAVTGNYVTAAGAMYATVNETVNGVLNFINGNYGYVSGSDRGGIYKFDNSYILTGIFTDTNVDPSNLTDNVGRPLNAVVTLRSCNGGYVKCSNVKLDSNADYPTKEEIITLLKGGVYLE